MDGRSVQRFHCIERVLVDDPGQLACAIGEPRNINAGGSEARVSLARRGADDEPCAWSRITSVLPRPRGDAPQWIGRTFRDPDPRFLVPCENGILDLRERELLPVTPRMFATYRVAAPWRRAPQPCPRWLTFLEQLWGDDEETIRTLQEMFGYFLTTDTS